MRLKMGILLDLLLVFFCVYLIYAIITGKKLFHGLRAGAQIIEPKPIYSESDIQRIGLHLKRLIDIINESIDIARKSTNAETKLSRLGVANDKLREIHDYLGRYPSISLSHLEKLQSRINELHEEFNLSGINSIASGQVLTARALLKQATQLKKEKQFDAACEKLKEAYSAYGANELMTKDFLRLPMYLQLAGRSEEGWDLLNDLLKDNTSIFDQAEIAHQIQIFLRKEKKYKLAVLFSAWEACEVVERDLFNVRDCIEMADIQASDDFLREISKNQEVYGYTPNGNPITQYSYDFFNNRLLESKTIEFVRSKLESDLEKSDCSEKLEQLSNDLHEYITSNNKYRLSEVIAIVRKYVNYDENGVFRLQQS
ncbi:hypothetical protein R2083_08230 [Nitrosomonas sp. Is35]|uniref:hypothetical protein n=1 Tax=Nitrosomonas sp. Is35 TaxID=3080534 RepID=UPI00294B01E6|nr:hypothetical protein [Nitrosomonas sp. Is35]MDV6347501.1 hypothetical protein [Nitrosomonas sp. Is35]